MVSGQRNQRRSLKIELVGWLFYFVHFLVMFFARITRITRILWERGACCPREPQAKMFSFSLSHVVYNVVRIANLGENGVNAITKLERL